MENLNKENADNSLPISTYKRDGSCRVEKGSVDIYVARQADNIGEKMGEESAYLCSVGEGEILPFYNFKDGAYVYWYFIIKGATGTDSVIESEATLTEEEKLSFLSKTPAAPFAYDGGINEANRFNESFAAWYEIEDMRAYSDAPEADESDIIKLDRTAEIYTESGDMGYTVKAGSVNVFVGTAYSGNRKKLFCLCTLQEGGKIPGFAFRDGDGVKWFFKITAAKESAELVKSQGELSARDKAEFLNSTNISTSENETEEYTDKIVDWYNTKLLKGILSGNSPEQNIIGPLSLEKHYIKGTLPLYKAVSYACFHYNIAHLSEDDTVISCGNDEMTVEKIADASHFICRKVILEDGWWKTDCGPIIGFIDKTPVACAPKGGGKYTLYYGSEDNATDDITLTEETARKISPNAYSIGRTLPEKELTGKDIFEFCKKSVNSGDVWMVVIFGLISALIGILLPTLNQKIYDDYIPLGSYSQLIQICVVIASFMIGNLFFGIVKNISEYRIGSRVGYDLQNAAIYRSYYLPEKFFREHDSADLAQRILQIDEITTAYVNLFVISGVSAVFSLVYLFQMFKYTSKLTWAALVMIAVYAVLVYSMSIKATAKEKVILSANGEASTRIYQFLRAIDKIRMAGAEERAVFRYVMPVRDREAARIQKEKILSLSSALDGVAVTIFSMVFYYILVKKSMSLSVGDFTAFNSALGSFTSAILGLLTAYLETKRTKPNLDRVMPVFEEKPEYSSDKGKSLQNVASLKGEIKIEDLSFSYSDNGPMILKNLNMTINPGDYVGIVGKSGSGKSTLLKLLLGFEKPTAGRVLIDKMDLAEIDKRSYRRRLGVVLQNGRLIEGSIQENITITAPGAKLADVKKVIKEVGLEEDVNNMPMGINTMLSENSSTISGGQQQRILIARALIGNPKVLFLDEATSALDNITQRIVYETIDKVEATKIVIAHRLSTIQNCNKIFVLDAGKIVEEGTYEELMKKKGLFAEMAARQLVDGGSDDD